MSELKTKRSDDSVEAFIAAVENEQRRADSIELLSIFEEATGLAPALWGSIVGYGQYHYRSQRSRQEGDWPLTGFSPRKASLTIYIMPGFDSFKHELTRLGKHKISVSCLYITNLANIDRAVLVSIIRKSVEYMKREYPAA